MIEITQQELDNLRLIKNHVMVKCNRYNDTLIVGQSGILFDTSFEPEKHSTTHATVVKVPEKIDALSNTKMQIQPGDEVHFHYLSLKGCHEDNRAFVVVGSVDLPNADNPLNRSLDSYYLIPYHFFYCAVRKEQIFALNNFILVEPIAEKQELIGEIDTNPIAVEEKRHLKDVGIIAHIPDGCTAVKPGDAVMFSEHSDIPVEYDMHQSLKSKYFRMKEDDILMVVGKEYDIYTVGHKANVKPMMTDTSNYMDDAQWQKAMAEKRETELEEHDEMMSKISKALNESRKKIYVMKKS